MSKYGGNNRIDFGVHFNTDKSSLEDVKKSLQALQNIKLADFKGSREELVQIKTEALKVQAALTKAFNVKIGSINIQKFRNELKGLNLDKLYTDFSRLGSQGQVAFSKMAASLMTTNLQLKETHSLINSMGTTMMNTVKWGIASSVMNNFTQSVSQAFQYVKSLDSALTDIRIVTGDSTDKMAEFADQANRAAQQLGRSTMDYSKAALTFYQQGLSDEDVAARTQATLKAQNITGAGQEMADYLTAVWNGYKVANEEAELYVDKLAAVADSSASNMAQLAVAMSKVASTANMLGVPVDSLNAQIATIEATTRQAPETVGNALKTIYARINDIKTGSDDAEVSLGNYTKQMAQLGVNVLDASGNLRDTGDVIEEIGGKWQTLSREQQIYLARTMAGQRQYNNLLALFENWGKYTDLLNVSMDAQGTTMQKNSRYMDSLAAHMEQLGAAGERVKSAMIDSDSFKGLIDIGTGLTNLFANLIESIGGGGTAFLALGSIVTQVFSGVISREIANVINNFKLADENAKTLARDIELTEQFGKSQAYSDGVIKSMVDAKKEAQQYYNVMSEGQINAYNGIVQQIGAAQEEKNSLQGIAQAANNINEAFNKAFGSEADSQLDILQTDLEELKQAKDDLYKNLNNGSETVDIFAGFKKQFESFSSSLGSFELPGLRDLKAKISDIDPAAQGSKEKIQELRIAINNLINESGKQFGLISQVDDLNHKTEQAKAKLDQATLAKDQFLDNIKTEAQVKQTISLVSAVGRLASGFMALSNITKVWHNDSLSTGQKILQTFTNLGFVIPMIASSLNTIQKAMGLQVTLGEVIFSSTTKRALAQKKITLEKEKQVLLDKIQGGDRSSKTVSQYDKVAKELEDIANKEKSLTFGSYFKDAGKSLGSLITKFGPYAIAVGAAAAATYVMVKAWNEAADKARKADQIATESTQHYKAIQSTVNQISQSIKKYSELQDNFKNLTKGTDQWNSALQESNQIVLDLIKKFPELASQVKNVHGQLIIDPQALEEAQKKLEHINQTMGLSNAEMQHQARQAAIRSNATDLGRQYSRAGGGLSSEGNEGISASGRFRNATENSQLNQTEILKVAQYLGDFEKGLLDNVNNLDELSNKISDETGIEQQLIKTLFDNKQATQGLRDIVAKTDADLQARDLEYQEKAANSKELTESKAYQGASDLDKQIMQRLGGQALQQKQSEFTKDVEKTIDGLTKVSSVNNENYKTLLNQLKQAGLNAKASTSSNPVTGTDNNRVVAFNVDGEEVKYRKEELASIIAASQALNDLGNSAKTTQGMLSELNKVGDNNAEGIRQLLAGNGFSGMTKGQVQGLNANSKEMQDYFNKNFKAAGYESAKAFKEDFLNEQKTTVNAFNNILKDRSQAVKDAYKSLNTDDLTLDAQQSIVDNLQKAFNEGGRQASDQLTSFYSKISDFDGFKEATAGLDFTTISISDLKQQLEKAGVATNLTTEELNAYIQAQKDAAEVISPEETYKNIHEIIDGLKRGDTIDEQQQQKLTDAGVNLDAFFSKMPDGTMKLKASAQDFYNYANNISLEGFKTQINELQNQIGKRQQFENESQWSASKARESGTLESTWSDFSSDTRGRDTEKLREQISLLETATNLSEEEKQIIAEINDGQGITKERTEKIAEAIKNHKDLWEDNKGSIEAIKEQVQELEEELNNANQIPLDADVDEQQWEDLAEYLNENADKIKELDEDVKTFKEDAEDLAEAMLRYDSALKSVNDNYEEWQRALSKGAIQDQVQAGEQLKNVYSDLLDLPFESLSSDFTQDINNLELLKQAANGSEKAYDQLRLKAMDDIVGRVGLDISDFTNESGRFYEQYTALQNGIDDLKIGAYIDDTNLYNQMNQIINASAKTAKEATDLLATMGIDAEVEQAEIDEDQVSNWIDAVPNVSYETVAVPEIVSADSGSLFGSAVNVLKGGSVQVPTISYSGEEHPQHAKGKKQVTAFRVKSAKKSSGGGFKFKQSSYGGGNKGSSGGNKGKKSGGKGKSYTPAKAVKNKIDTKEKETKNDPYYKNTLSLQKQSKLLKKLQNQQKHLTGKDRLKNLNAQNENLKEQNKLLRERQKISNNKAYENSTADLADKLQKIFGKNIFNTDGTIKDLNALEKSAVDVYNKAVNEAEAAYKKKQDAYNKWLLNTYNKNQEKYKKEKETRDQKLKDEEQKAKDVIALAEEEYKKKTDLIKDYQKALEEDQKHYQQYLDNIHKIIETSFEKSKIKVDLALDSGQLMREYQQFEDKIIRKIKDDDIVGQAASKFRKISSYFDSEELKKVNDDINQITKDILAIESGNWSSILTDDLRNDSEWNELLKSGDQAAIKKYGEDLLQDRLKELVKKQEDALIELQELTDEMMQAYLDSIDAAKDAFDEHIAQYERIGDLIEHNIKLSELLYGDKGYDTLNKYYNLQKENDTRTLNLLRQQENILRNQMNQQIVGSEAWKKFKEQLDDTVDQINSKIEDMLDNLAKQFQNKITAAIDKINYKLTNGLGTDYIDDQWDYLNQYDDYFLDTYNATTGVEDVTRAYQKAIDDAAANPKQQQKLNGLMQDQLKILKEKDKLTQYDLDRAKSVLEVEKARMALEDARNNKTKMRLRRDSQGNYTYQYVADEEKLSDLQDALAKAQNDLYNTDKEHYKENLNQIYDTYKEFLERMQDLTLEYNQARAYTESTGDKAWLNSVEKQIMQEQEQFNEIMTGYTEDNNYNKLYVGSSFENGLGLDLSNLFDEEYWQVMKENIPWAKSNIQDLVDNAKDLGGFLLAIKPLLSSFAQYTEEYQTDINQILEAGGTSLQTVGQAIDENGKALDQHIQQSDNKQTMQYLQNASTEALRNVDTMKTFVKQLDDYWKSQNKELKDFVKNVQDGTDALLLLDESKMKTLNLDYNYEDQSTTTSQGINQAKSNLKQEGITGNNINTLYNNYVKDMINGGFEKQDFTIENLQTSTKDLQLLTNYAATMQNILDSTSNLAAHPELIQMSAATSQLVSNLLKERALLNQNVHIDASFPNVTGSHQIEEAFNNLVNMAAMHASNYKD